MNILIDRNLSPLWVSFFKKEGWTAQHWSQVGEHGDSDQTIMQWAKENNYLVFTHDLDFGAILAATKAEGPSVIQVRTQGIFPESLASLLIKVIHQFQTTLSEGALLTVDETKARIRILPLR